MWRSLALLVAPRKRYNRSFDLPTEREIELLLTREFANFPAHFDVSTTISKLVGMSYADI
jgi:hypothetical protein